jgi:hypothetical protein
MSNLTAPPPRQVILVPAVPPRFFIGMGMIFTVLMGALFTIGTRIESMHPRAVQWAPMLTAISLVVCGSAFLMAFGAPQPKAILLATSLALVFSIIAMVPEYFAHKPIRDDQSNYTPIDIMLQLGALLVLIIALPLLVEAAALLPTFILIRLGRVTSMRSAMICAAISGLICGLIESNEYAFLGHELPGLGGGQWVGRFVGWSLTHGVWAAAGAGLAYHFARRKLESVPSTGDFVKAFAIIFAVHFADALLALITPATQIVTMLALLPVVYGLGKSAWREEPAGEPQPN